ncbi:hypothetical protein [Hyphomonas sp.]|uniref:hypothetical protein n=1 Tax=Hyphomonas sp. TaxID=87 RepID=UPI003D2C9B95
MTLLFPRLSRLTVERIYDHISESADVSNIRDALNSVDAITSELPESVKYGATGGTKVSEEALRQLRNDLTAIAKAGMNSQFNNQLARSHFDTEITKYLADFEALNSSEALRDDVWAFLASSCLTILTIWRFQFAKDRFHGGVRNTFQRLWLRARALDRGPDSENRWELIEELTEDAMVQITERPSIGGDRVLASAVAEAWINASRKFGRAPMEAIMRKAIIGVRLRNQVVALSQLPTHELSEFVRLEFEQAARTIQRAQSA